MVAGSPLRQQTWPVPEPKLLDSSPVYAGPAREQRGRSRGVCGRGGGVRERGHGSCQFCFWLHELPTPTILIHRCPAGVVHIQSRFPRVLPITSYQPKEARLPRKTIQRRIIDTSCLRVYGLRARGSSRHSTPESNQACFPASSVRTRPSKRSRKETHKFHPHPD